MRLRVVTYNIHRAIGVDRRFRPDRIIQILRHHAPEVVLLQEVDEGAFRSKRLDLARVLAKELAYPHYVVGHNVSLRRGRYGNAILSRFPIERERNIDLSVESRKRRGCQNASIQLGKTGRLEVFNLHLGLSARERARQMGILARSDEFSSLPSNAACLLGGDFNDWRLLLHPIMTEIFQFHCATQRGYGADGSIRTYPSFSPTGGLDRVYYRGPIRLISAHRCRLRLSRVASDHLPVVVDFQID